MKNIADTREALAVAIHAFHVNGNKVVKETTQDSFSNKMYVWEHFSPPKTVDSLPRINIDQTLLDAADKIRTTIEHSVTMSILTKGKISSFIQSVYDIVKEDQIHFKNFGVLVWAPKLVEDLEKSQSLREISSAYELKSKFIGKQGEKFELDFNLIEKRFVRSLGIWSAYGHTTDGNLVKFLSKHEDLCASQKIKARIKAHDIDSYHNNARVTSLNFVKTI